MQSTVPGPGDILFHCSHCQAALVVDAAAAGHTLNCSSCQEAVTVPATSQNPPLPEAGDPKLADARRRLKENESQRTEITSYINQLSIQLSRWQLRLKTLNERRDELLAEIETVQGTAGPA